MIFFFHLAFRICSIIFFKDIQVIGKENIPKKGPLIVCGNHANQFIDAILMLSTVGRHISFIIAAKSMKRIVIGLFARAIGCIPVERPQDSSYNGKGVISCIINNIVKGYETNFKDEIRSGDTLKVKDISEKLIVDKVISNNEIKLISNISNNKQILNSSFKISPKLDQTNLYTSVWNALINGDCIGMFPEGGSHDRTELLPLKAGVSIMALGAASKCKESIKIICCGFNYFKGHHFRSKVLIDYDKPYTIPRSMIELYSHNKKEAITQLLSEIEKRMRYVTIQAPSYNELSAIYLARSLYMPNDIKLDYHNLFILHQKFADVYKKYKNHKDVYKLFTSSIQIYHHQLRQVGIQDIQVRRLQPGLMNNFLRMIYSVIMLMINAIIALPGIIINGPIALIIKILSEKERQKALAASSVKIKGLDVVGSYKIICAIVAFPIAAFIWTYTFYLIFTYIIDLSYSLCKTLTLIFFIIWPAYSYVMIISADGFIRHFKNLKTRFLILIFPEKINNLRDMRLKLQQKIREFVDKYGVEILNDIGETHIQTIDKENISIQEQIKQSKSVNMPNDYQILKEIKV